MSKVIIFHNPVTDCLAFIDPGYGDILRPVGQTDEELIALNRRLYVPAGVASWVVDEAEVTVDQTFRDAWECPAGRVVFNMVKARTIHMNKIRLARNSALEVESGSRVRQPAEIEALFTTERKARLQALRDIPQTFSLTTPNNTPNELKALWPAGLPRP